MSFIYDLVVPAAPRSATTGFCVVVDDREPGDVGRARERGPDRVLVVALPVEGRRCRGPGATIAAHSYRGRRGRPRGRRCVSAEPSSGSILRPAFGTSRERRHLAMRQTLPSNGHADLSHPVDGSGGLCRHGGSRGARRRSGRRVPGRRRRLRFMGAGRAHRRLGYRRAHRGRSGHTRPGGHCTGAGTNPRLPGTAIRSNRISRVCPTRGTAFRFLGGGRHRGACCSWNAILDFPRTCSACAMPWRRGVCEGAWHNGHGYWTGTG